MKEELDPLFNEAARLVVEEQNGAPSFIQRRLSLGYNKAGRIVDQLEANGIIGAFQGSKPREVFIKTIPELEEKLLTLSNL